MSALKKMLLFSGSIRSNSVNAYLLKAIQTIGKDVFEFVNYSELQNLPYFNPEIGDDHLPWEVEDLRNAIASADVLLICTPEYVFSLPGILKNALEWTVSTMVFDMKPCIPITASSLGEKAHESLLLILRTMGARIEDDWSIHIPGAKTKISSHGEITDSDLLHRIKQMLNSVSNALN